MKNLILLLCILTSYSLYSQSLSQTGIFSATDNSRNGYAEISWTLGDNQTTTYSTDNLIITQGFLQTEIIVTDISNIEENNAIEMQVYPNPVLDILNLKVSSEKKMDIQLKLYTIDGKLTYSKEVEANNYNGTVDFKQFESGIYILKAFTKDKRYIKTFKIFYQN